MDIKGVLSLVDKWSKPLQDATEKNKKFKQSADKMKKASEDVAKGQKQMTDALGRNITGLSQSAVKMGLWIDKAGKVRNASGKFASAQEKLAAGVRKTNTQMGLSKFKFDAANTSANRMLGTVLRLASAYLTLQGAMKLHQATVGGAMKLEQEIISMEHFIANNVGDEALAAQMTNDYVARLRKNAAETPFEENEVLAAGRRSVQISGGDTTRAEEILEIAEDMAALNPDKTLSQSIEAIADLMTGETERIEFCPAA